MKLKKKIKVIKKKEKQIKATWVNSTNLPFTTWDILGLKKLDFQKKDLAKKNQS